MSLGRRDVLCLVLALFSGRLAAQVPPAAKVYRIGWLGTAHTDSEWDQFIEGLRRGLLHARDHRQSPRQLCRVQRCAGEHRGRKAA